MPIVILVVIVFEDWTIPLFLVLDVQVFTGVPTDRIINKAIGKKWVSAPPSMLSHSGSRQCSASTHENERKSIVVTILAYSLQNKISGRPNVKAGTARTITIRHPLNKLGIIKKERKGKLHRNKNPELSQPWFSLLLTLNLPTTILFLAVGDA